MLFLVILLYALFGFTFTLGKIVLFYASPFFVVATRMMIGGLALMAYLTFFHKIKCWPHKNDFWLFAQFIFFNICAFYGSRSWALQYLTTSKAALLMNLSPFFTALLAYIFLKEKISLLKALGLFIGFSGMLPILIAQSSPEENIWGSIAFLSTPELVLICAVGCLSYSMIVMQKLVKHRNVNPILVNSISMVYGGAAMGLTSIARAEKMIFGDPVLFWSVIGMQIIVSNILCSNLQAFLLRTYSTTFLAFASFISPLCALGYGALLLNEVITWHFFASFFIVIIGLTIFYVDDIRQGKLTQA
ncbi:MAG: DMT family transporter [Candidatus Babeliaceae bacterium]|nr:DMT family transporter [Candidatus Babeliaceae bacterium]